MVIVDEVQDSDRSQLEFLEALKGPETKIFAVGDPNQVIYSFRGTTQNMFFLLKNRFRQKNFHFRLITDRMHPFWRRQTVFFNLAERFKAVMNAGRRFR